MGALGAAGLGSRSSGVGANGVPPDAATVAAAAELGEEENLDDMLESQELRREVPGEADFGKLPEGVRSFDPFRVIPGRCGICFG